MENEGLALHAHTFSVSIDTYESTPGLRDFMKITQKDTWTRNYDGVDVEFINSMEARDYPIFTTMYHPEYQMIDYLGNKRWTHGEEELTQEIAFRISLVMNRHARMNSNKVAPQNEEFFNKLIGINRIPAQAYPMLSLTVFAYGYLEHPETIPDFER